MWTTLLRLARDIGGGLAFTKPFIAPAFLGGLINGIWRKHFRRGIIALCSAVISSTLIGMILTPLFAYVMGFPPDVASSAAGFIAIVGYEVINWLLEKFGIRKEPWDGRERRSCRTGTSCRTGISADLANQSTGGDGSLGADAVGTGKAGDGQ